MTDNTFESSIGVPQGGVLSPILFVHGLDFILNKDNVIVEMIEDGSIQAFADDISVAVDPSQTWKINYLVNYLASHNLV